MKTLHKRCAGIDVHKTEVVACLRVITHRKVEREVRRQLELFRDLVGREPTHLDSHQHVHLSEPAESVARQVARELGVVLRERSGRVRHCGEFYGQTGTGESYPEGISTDQVVGRLLESVEPPRSGL